jgi:hypothetical protein
VGSGSWYQDRFPALTDTPPGARSGSRAPRPGRLGDPATVGAQLPVPSESSGGCRKAELRPAAAHGLGRRKRPSVYSECTQAEAELLVVSPSAQTAPFMSSHWFSLRFHVRKLHIPELRSWIDNRNGTQKDKLIT